MERERSQSRYAAIHVVTASPLLKIGFQVSSLTCLLRTLSVDDLQNLLTVTNRNGETPWLPVKCNTLRHFSIQYCLLPVLHLGLTCQDACSDLLPPHRHSLRGRIRPEAGQEATSSQENCSCSKGLGWFFLRYFLALKIPSRLKSFICSQPNQYSNAVASRNW